MTPNIYIHTQWLRTLCTYIHALLITHLFGSRSTWWWGVVFGAEKKETDRGGSRAADGTGYRLACRGERRGISGLLEEETRRKKKKGKRDQGNRTEEGTCWFREWSWRLKLAKKKEALVWKEDQKVSASPTTLFSLLPYLAPHWFLGIVWTECGLKAILLIYLFIFERIVSCLLLFHILQLLLFLLKDDFTLFCLYC